MKAGQGAGLRVPVVLLVVWVSDGWQGCAGGCAEERDQVADCVDAETGRRTGRGGAWVVWEVAGGVHL